MPEKNEDRRSDGAAAFKAGKPRHSNPHDENSEAWASWMDGFDQAEGKTKAGSPDPTTRRDEP